MSKPDAYTRQEAGNHYVNMGMQPFQFAMANQWDFAASSILKYVSRWRAKNGSVDLRKALHIVDIRLAEIKYALPSQNRVTMFEYNHLNKIEGDDARALLMLEDWVNGHGDEKQFVALLQDMIVHHETKDS